MNYLIGGEGPPKPSQAIHPRSLHPWPCSAVCQDESKLSRWFWLSGGTQSWDMEKDQVLMASFETLDPSMPRTRPAS